MRLHDIKVDFPVLRETAAGIFWRPFLFCLCLFSAIPVSAAVDGVDSNQYVQTSASALLAGGQPALLDEVIVRYEQIRDAGGWPMPGDGPALAAGMRHEDARVLRKRLRITDNFTAEMGADPLLFDSALEIKLRVFQRNHGIPVSGMLGGVTRQALNIDVQQRINELRYARNAWTQYAEANAASRLWVNIPEATVIAVADNQIVMQMRAIVGHPSRPTPVISSSIERVVINPTWTVPTSIALNDLIPRQIRNSNYFSNSHIRVYKGWDEESAELDPKHIDWTGISSRNFPYRLRQDPGPFNSLGRIKFIFPNAHDIYLHDTPTRALLGLSYRTVSSGCIRVEDPKILANWMVTEQSRERINQLLNSSDYTPRSVRVAGDVGIELAYITAWVSPVDGTIQFRQDIYGLATAAERVAEH